MNRDSLADWLAWQESLHWRSIDLGLTRLLRVYERLALSAFKFPVITVGGTNGKGSCVAMLASILRAGGYRVGTFTSPHLMRYNERIQIDDREISDASLIAAFERIEAVRGEESLTYFEFNTLAALLIFDTAGLDVAVLEVGMGGRLDTVNLVDADVALITSIGLDHCEYLGTDLESIGREKAGIFRPHRVAIYGSRAMPRSIADSARQIGTELRRLGVQFDYSRAADVWHWRGVASECRSLPAPGLIGDVQFDNAAAVLAVLEVLRQRLPVTAEAIASGLRSVQLPGRFQVRLLQGVTWIFDVAHNPAAADTLAARLAAMASVGRTIAVCGIVGDKDIEGVVRSVTPQIQHWIVAGLNSPRALSTAELGQRIASAGATVAATASTVAEACALARSEARAGDRVIVFGSFSTVGPALEWIEKVSNAGH
ncbi:MAG: bifunctional tetrahydrofolate synthase/dihydrofolate synthase [Steroidobacteraceae bacterium]